MNKKLTGMISLFLTVVLFFTSCGGDEDGKDTDTDASGIDTDSVVGDNTPPDDGIPRNTVYRIASITEYSNGDIVSGERYGYNESGLIIYKRDTDETEPYYEVTYDDDGNIKEIIDKNAFYSNRVITFENGYCVLDEKRIGDYANEKCEYKYDENGNLISYAAYIKDTLIERREYTYDGDDRVIHSLVKTWNDNLDLYTNEEEEKVYDENGNLIKVTSLWYKEGEKELEIPICYEYEYDSVGNCVLYSKLTQDGERNIIEEYSYDSEGRQISVTRHDHMNYFKDIVTVYTYSERGDVLSAKTYNTFYSYTEPHEAVREELTYSLECTYDKDGNLLSHDETWSENTRDINEYTYDDEGRLLAKSETHYNSDHVYGSEYEYAYAADGHTETRIDYFDGEENLKFTEEYDSAGNLILSMYSGDGVEKSRTEYTYREFFLTEEEAEKLTEIEDLIAEADELNDLFGDPNYGQIG